MGSKFRCFCSQSERRFNTQNVRYDGHVFLCKMNRTMSVQKWPFQICGMSGGRVPEGHTIVFLNSCSPGHLNSWQCSFIGFPFCFPVLLNFHFCWLNCWISTFVEFPVFLICWISTFVELLNFHFCWISTFPVLLNFQLFWIPRFFCQPLHPRINACSPTPWTLLTYKTWPAA